jgi:hypothetical protein
MILMKKLPMLAGSAMKTHKDTDNFFVTVDDAGTINNLND